LARSVIRRVHRHAGPSNSRPLNFSCDDRARLLDRMTFQSLQSPFEQALGEYGLGLERSNRNSLSIITRYHPALPLADVKSIEASFEKLPPHRGIPYVRVDDAKSSLLQRQAQKLHFSSSTGRKAPSPCRRQRPPNASRRRRADRFRLGAEERDGETLCNGRQVYRHGFQAMSLHLLIEAHDARSGSQVGIVWFCSWPRSN